MSVFEEFMLLKIVVLIVLDICDEDIDIFGNFLVESLIVVGYELVEKKIIIDDIYKVCVIVL